MTTKKCTKCGANKPTAEFGKHAITRDGLNHKCKSCVKIAYAAWYAVNPEKAREATIKWKSANVDKNKAKEAAYKLANKDRTRANSVAYYAANRERVLARGATWKATHPDAGRVHGHNRRARLRESGGRLSPDITAKLLELQRGKCACGCKQPLGDDYHLDHILPIALGGPNIDENIQLLRASCNYQKHAKHPVDFMQQRGFLL